MQRRLHIVFSLAIAILMLGSPGCALFRPAPDRAPRDVIADAERSVQRLSASISALAPLIEDQDIRDALDAAIGEANDAVAAAHELEAKGEPIGDRYLEDRVWSAINRALTLYTKHKVEADQRAASKAATAQPTSRDQPGVAMIDPVTLIAILNIADGLIRDATRKPEPKTTPEEAELLRALTEVQVAGAQYILRNPPQKAT